MGVGPLPGPVPPPTALVGGAALYVTEGKSDLEQAAAWDFMKYMVSPEVQSSFEPFFGRRRRVPIAIDDSVVRKIDRVVPSFSGFARQLGWTIFAMCETSPGDGRRGGCRG